MKDILALDADAPSPALDIETEIELDITNGEPGTQPATQRKETPANSRDKDIVTIYLNDMGRTPLIDKDKEVELGERRERAMLGMIECLISTPLLLQCLKEFVPTNPFQKDDEDYDSPLTAESLAQAVRAVSKHHTDLHKKLWRENAIECTAKLNLPFSFFENIIGKLKAWLKENKRGPKKTNPSFRAIYKHFCELEVARKEMLEANLRWGVKLAKRYQWQGLNLLDLIQEANIGILKTIDKFQHRRGFKFSTYATHWIRQTITKAIRDKGRTIRVPAHLGEELSRLNRVNHDLQSEETNQPSPEEVAKRLNIPVAKVVLLLSLHEPISLDAPLGEDNEGHPFSSLVNLVEDTAIEHPDAELAQSQLRERIEQILSTLPPKEEEILRLRFGFDGEEHTLEAIGEKFSVTRERIRQIEYKALRTIRKPCLNLIKRP